MTVVSGSACCAAGSACCAALPCNNPYLAHTSLAYLAHALPSHPQPSPSHRLRIFSPRLLPTPERRLRIHRLQPPPTLCWCTSPTLRSSVAFTCRHPAAKATAAARPTRQHHRHASSRDSSSASTTATQHDPPSLLEAHNPQSQREAGTTYKIQITRSINSTLKFFTLPPPAPLCVRPLNARKRMHKR